VAHVRRSLDGPFGKYRNFPSRRVRAERPILGDETVTCPGIDARVRAERQSMAGVTRDANQGLRHSITDVRTPDAPGEGSSAELMHKIS